MAAAANIVLNDAQATPVAHTFIPLGPDQNDVRWWEDQSGASPLGYNRISMALVRPSLTAAQGVSSDKRVCRVKMQLHTPKLENTTNSTVSGVQPAPTLSYVPRVSVEFILPERSALQDRKDIRKFAQFLLADTAIVNAVESLQGVW